MSSPEGKAEGISKLNQQCKADVVLCLGLCCGKAGTREKPHIVPGGNHFVFIQIPTEKVMNWITRDSKS